MHSLIAFKKWRRPVVTMMKTHLADVGLRMAETTLKHFNAMIARQHVTEALSYASQVDNTAWVRGAHGGLGHTLVGTGE